jgi:hypothetical protein
MPQLPDLDKNFVKSSQINISTTDSREKIVDYLNKSSAVSEPALLAVYVYRQMDSIDWHPFIKAAIERNPVCFSELNGKSYDEVFSILESFPGESIYEGNRLALPDEVWNFRRGDGVEKALLMADFIIHSDMNSKISIDIDGEKVLLATDGIQCSFISSKNFRRSIRINGNDYRIDDLKLIAVSKGII